MDEAVLLKLSFICAIAGLAILALISYSPPGQVMIDRISPEEIGSSVGICGKVVDSKVSDGHIFLDISDSTGRIRYVIFNSSAGVMGERGLSPYTLGEGQSLCAQGIVEEYPKGSGRLELVYKRGDILIY